VSTQGHPADKHAVMTFEEIGRCLGIKEQVARCYFVRGITKLKKRPEALKRLCELAAERQRIMREFVFPDWSE